MNSRQSGLLAITLLTLACLVTRLVALPGWWDADGLHYAALTLEIREFGPDNRALRFLFRGLLEIGEWLGGGAYGGLTFVCAVAGVAAVPATFLAAWRRLGTTGALWAAALIGSLPVLYHETIRPSADGGMATFGALLLLAATGLDDERASARLRAAGFVGLVAGVGGVYKELFLLGALPLAFWMLWKALRGRLAWSAILLAGVAAIAPVVGDYLLTQWLVDLPGRYGEVSGHMAAVRGVDTYPASRFYLGPLPMMLTDRYALGSLYAVAGLVLCSGFRRIPHMATELVVGIGTVVVLWWIPISSQTYAVLPVSEPRYLLCGLPAVAIALVGLVDRPARLRRTWWLPGLLALPLLVLFRGQLGIATSVATAAVLLSGRLPLGHGQVRVGVAAAALGGLAGLALPPAVDAVVPPLLAVAAVCTVGPGRRRLAGLLVLGAWFVVMTLSHADTHAQIRRTHALREHVRELGRVHTLPYIEAVLRVTAGRAGADWTELRTWDVEQTDDGLAPGSHVLTWRGDKATRARLAGMADETRMFEVYSLYRVR